MINIAQIPSTAQPILYAEVLERLQKLKVMNEPFVAKLVPHPNEGHFLLKLETDWTGAFEVQCFEHYAEHFTLISDYPARLVTKDGIAQGISFMAFG